ncbi:MAG: exodeoxyribonuclease V subunit alpha [Proteobacteria bacterium]|nr:exodeoxyribonuclease V subunit alpha [Pseudomonadota bacterium]MBU1738109.1 exodeoxyribonuclease V subunit alpha [Pseudomonadota bacterium]
MDQKLNFNALDRYFGSLISRLADKTDPEIRTAAELVSLATREGHGCIDLREWAGQQIRGAGGVDVCLPDFDVWHEKIANSVVAGSGTELVTPLVLENERLYLRRYWEYEEEIVSFLLQRGSRGDFGDGDGAPHEILNRLFPDEGGEFRWHRLAALSALRRSVTCIIGGPGTGKTTAVAGIMALLVECSGDCGMRIALTAPTGKAVMRLQESIAKSLSLLDSPSHFRSRIPVRATTIHRLLGVIRDAPNFRYHGDNRLPYDLVVVDEASMVDLPLMAKLVRALPEQCRLVLLGDRDQLSSVEPGAVFGDICCRSMMNCFSRSFISEATILAKTDDLDLSGQEKGGLADSLVGLRRGFRFAAESGVGRLARAVNVGNGDEVLRLAHDEECPEIIWRECTNPDQIESLLREILREIWWNTSEQSLPGELLASLGKFQILCALRNGPFGVAGINAFVRKSVVGNLTLSGKMNYHQAQPIMVSRNDYQLELFNGDTGVVARDPGHHEHLRAFFRASEGVRSVSLLSLPPHESCYAMTVHKSQGSEFDRVILVMPDKKSPVLTRELVYTAVSRAREKIEIWGSEDVLRVALDAVTSRRGGLQEKLWGDDCAR